MLELLQEDSSDEWLFINLPFSDVRESIQHESLYEEVDSAFPLTRLAHIKALGFLSYRFDSFENKNRAMVAEFNHDRYTHSYQVAILSEKVAKRNNLPETMVTKITIAGLLHDIATPALGDATKLMDPHNLDEETTWPELVTPEGQHLLDKYHFPQAELGGIIRNEGMLGKLLDYTDRIVYTMEDVAAVNKLYKLIPQERYRDVNRISRYDKTIGNIYRDLILDPKTESIYFNDPRRLQHFLHLRALMHYQLYRNPVTAGRDWTVAKFIEPFYSADLANPKPLTPLILRQMNDLELMQFLCLQYHRPQLAAEDFYHSLTEWTPSFVTSGTLAEAKQEEQRLRKRKDIVVLDTIVSNGFKPATDYLTKGDDGRIDTLHNIWPEGAEEVEDIAEASKGIYTFYADISDNMPFSTLLKEVIAD